MDDINQWLHSVAGLNSYRPSIRVRKDAFYEYLPVPNDVKDALVLQRLSHTVADLSQVCFHHCVDPQFKHFTSDEAVCIEKCVRGYFSGFEEVVEATQQRIESARQQGVGQVG